MTDYRILVRRLNRAVRMLRMQGRYRDAGLIRYRWSNWHQRRCGTPF